MSISLLDSTELNNNLSLISNTIKQKTNNNTQLSFPSNFIEQLNTLYTIDDWFDLNKPEGNIYYTSSGITNGLLLGRKKINNFFGKNLTNLGASCLLSTSIKIIILPKCNTLYTNSLSGCSNLLIADFGGTPTSSQGFIRDGSFSGDSKMSTLILRANTVWTLSYVSTLNSTPFASGKAGGTIYVPQAQIENYKTATNWSTILSYTKSDGETLQNQILPIEGSIYETQYADGTPIPAE